VEVFAGAKQTDPQSIGPHPQNPASAVVGTSGNFGCPVGGADDEAPQFLPSRMKGRRSAQLDKNRRSARPDMTSVSASGPLLTGM